jgi:Bacterial lipid A biosynthesis acyltransferase
MTPEQEDAAVEELRRLVRSGTPEDELQARSLVLAQGYATVARKALWVYRQCSGHPALTGSPDLFYLRHLEAWRRFLLAAARGRGPDDAMPEGSRGPRKLFFGWHFPEYPLWLENMGRWGLLLLVARVSRWMEETAGRDALCNFRDPALNFAIPRALKAGRPIYAMFDYCYPDSHSVVSELLGRPSRTPTGLLRLARRFGYEIQVVSERDGLPAILDTFDPAQLSVEECALRINAAIESEILRDPARWLLWAIAEDRW